jgi:acyl-CoA thioester hydrolase
VTELQDVPVSTAESYVVEVGVRWVDQDPLGHVNHAVAVVLMAEARMQWLAEEAVEEGYEDFRLPKVVASLTLDYSSPVEYGSPLAMAMSVTRIGTRSYTLRHHATQDGQTRFTGSVVLVPRDAESGQARAVTKRERSYLARFREADAG